MSLYPYVVAMFRVLMENTYKESYTHDKSLNVYLVSIRGEPQGGYVVSTRHHRDPGTAAGNDT